MRYATCHPGRREEARGLCNACYLRAWYRGELPQCKPKPCALCGGQFKPKTCRATLCSDTCKRIRRSRQISAARAAAGVPQDNYLNTHDVVAATELVRILRSRGLRRVGRKTRRDRMAGAGYFSAWRVSTSPECYLYTVRYFDPAEAAEESEEVAAA